MYSRILKALLIPVMSGIALSAFPKPKIAKCNSDFDVSDDSEEPDDELTENFREKPRKKVIYVTKTQYKITEKDCNILFSKCMATKNPEAQKHCINVISIEFNQCVARIPSQKK